MFLCSVFVCCICFCSRSVPVPPGGLDGADRERSRRRSRCVRARIHPGRALSMNGSVKKKLVGETVLGIGDYFWGVIFLLSLGLSLGVWWRLYRFYYIGVLLVESLLLLVTTRRQKELCSEVWKTILWEIPLLALALGSLAGMPMELAGETVHKTYCTVHFVT